MFENTTKKILLIVFKGNTLGSIVLAYIQLFAIPGICVCTYMYINIAHYIHICAIILVYILYIFVYLYFYITSYSL